MQLTINGEAVSYSLENEKSLGQVVEGIRSWLATAGFLVTDLAADGLDLLRAPPQSWGGRTLESVQALDVKATHTGDVKLGHWRTVATWLAMLSEALASLPAQASAGAAGAPSAGAEQAAGAVGGDSALDALLGDLPLTMKGFTANPFMPPGSDLVKRFGALFTPATDGAAGGAPHPGSWAREITAWGPDRREEAAAVVRGLLAAAQVRIAEATHPREALARCVQRMQPLLSQLREVSVQLQTGRDREAMETLVRFTDVVRSIMDLLPFLPPDPERVRLITELTPQLREVVSAFGSRDAVLIGDLLEYEIAPRMERLAPLLEKST